MRKPFLIGVTVGKVGFQLLIGDDFALFQIDQQHLAGLKPPFPDNVFFRNIEHAHFRRQQHKAVLGLQVSCGTQPVTVERGTDHSAIRERNRRGAIPGLHQGGIVFVECAQCFIHQRIAGPGFGDEHHHGVRQRVATLIEQLQRIVETRGIGLPFI